MPTAQTTQIHCPHCEQPYFMTPQQAPQYLGQTIPCSNCGKPFTVGGESARRQAAARGTMAPQNTMGYAAPAAARKTSGLAIASLVCGLLFLVPIIGIFSAIAAIILGIVALVRTRDPAVGGKGLAISGIVLGGLGIILSIAAVAILIPSIGRARDTASQIKCASNMRQIGFALVLYSNANRGQLPPNLRTLVRNTDISAQTITCPSAGRDAYVYLGAGKRNADMGGAMILLYEPIGRHDDGAANFLFGDGSVHALEGPDAENAIEQLEAGQNPPRGIRW